MQVEAVRRISLPQSNSASSCILSGLTAHVLLIPQRMTALELFPIRDWRYHDIQIKLRQLAACASPACALRLRQWRRYAVRRRFFRHRHVLEPLLLAARPLLVAQLAALCGAGGALDARSAAAVAAAELLAFPIPSPHDGTDPSRASDGAATGRKESNAERGAARRHGHADASDAGHSEGAVVVPDTSVFAARHAQRASQAAVALMQCTTSVAVAIEALVPLVEAATADSSNDALTSAHLDRRAATWLRSACVPNGSTACACL